MKIKKKKLDEIIDNYLQSDLLQENKKLLNEQSGRNTMVSWRMPSAGQECQLNISSLLTKKGMSSKAAQNLNDGVSFILSRFMGANSWMCDIINIGLEVPRAITDTSGKEKPSSKIITPWLVTLTEDDWKSTIYKDVVIASKFKDALYGSSSDSVFSKIQTMHKNTDAEKKSKSQVTKFITKIKSDLLDGEGDKTKFNESIGRIDDNTATTALSELLYGLTEMTDAKAALSANSKSSAQDISNYQKKLKDLFGL